MTPGSWSDRSGTDETPKQEHGPEDQDDRQHGLDADGDAREEREREHPEDADPECAGVEHERRRMWLHGWPAVVVRGFGPVGIAQGGREVVGLDTQQPLAVRAKRALPR